MALVATPPSSPSPVFTSRPQPPRRPSALRKASSDHIITPAVTRFDPQTSHIPPSILSTDPSRFRPRNVSPCSPSYPTSPPTTTSLSLPLLTNNVPASPPARPPVQPLASPTSRTSPSSASSLLARRRSSRTAARPDILPLLDDLKLPDLPIPPLDHLDDTVVGEVIGVSTQSQTPSHDVLTPGSRDAVVVEKPYKPTRSFVPTPFPEKRKIFFDSKDEGGESDDEQDGETDTGSEPSPSAVEAVTEGMKWLPLQDVEKPSMS
ncbi:hypothetical protein JCM1841_002207 [Sporobolomyces salmonicolor]